MVVFFIATTSLTFIGCEDDDKDNEVLDVESTNTASRPHKTKPTSSTTTQSVSENTGGGNNLPPGPTTRSIEVQNNTAGTTITVTISTITRVITPGSLDVWTISGPAVMSYNAGAGGSNSADIGNDTFIYHYKFTDSINKPGSVKLSGGAQN